MSEALEDFARRVVSVCNGVIERVAEVGEPPPWLSGTQIDAVRMRQFALEALAADEKEEK